jgi:hypothetical protein
MASIILFNGALTSSFAPSLPATIVNDTITLAFRVTTPGNVVVSWYPEFLFSDQSPSGSSPPWAREVAEEDIGNGDVRMPFTIRRFTKQGSDAKLDAGTYLFSVQLKRSAFLYRLQLAGNGVQMTVTAGLGEIPVAP